MTDMFASLDLAEGDAAAEAGSARVSVYLTGSSGGVVTIAA
jgi:hypothetical protein